MSDREDSRGSNGSPISVDMETENSGTMNVDGDIIGFEETDDELQITYPDGMPEDKLAALTAKEKELKAALAAAKKKGFESNRKAEELAERERKLAEREAALATAPAATQTHPAANQSNAMAKRCWGVETFDDAEDLRVSDPTAYYEGLARFNQESASSVSAQRVQEEFIRNAIRSEGFNPQEIEAHAKAFGIVNLSTAFEHYKLKNAKKSAGISLPELQKKAAKFAPSGKGGAGGGNGKPKSVREIEGD